MKLIFLPTIISYLAFSKQFTLSYKFVISGVRFKFATYCKYGIYKTDSQTECQSEI